MQLHVIPSAEIIIRSNRQRRQFSQESILQLAGSISESGLLHPVVVRWADDEYTLVAGERRIKALEHLWFLGQEVICNDHSIPEGHVPCLYLGELSDLAAEEAELDENLRREDLTWQERADATARLDNLRARQAEKEGGVAPNTADIARELSPESTSGLADGELGAYQANVRKDIILGNALQDPVKREVIKSAISRKDAFKLLKRHEEASRYATLAKALGPSFTRSLHTLLQGDCLSLMPNLPAASFDVICADPPYGIGADDFGDSGGKAAGAHFYDDSPDTWRELVAGCAAHLTRLVKPSAHAYVFCDITRFNELAAIFRFEGWRVFRTPLIWHKPDGMRAPWPEAGPQRKYEVILYALRGDRPVTRLYPDLVSYPSDANLGHPAQKPIALLSDLLRRSIRPGDSVLDPFCGTGSTLVAGHGLQCKVTGIELDPAAFGIAAKRLEGLK